MGDVERGSLVRDLERYPEIERIRGSDPTLPDSNLVFDVLENEVAIMASWVQLKHSLDSSSAMSPGEAINSCSTS